MSRDFDKAQEMVVASMEYVKVLGFRIRRTEVQRDDWKQVAQSHADEVIKLRQHVDALKAERDAAKQEAVSARQDAVTRAEADRKRIDGLMIQAQDMRAEIERLKKPRQHPVKVGESVRRTTEGSIAPIGTLGRVLVVWSDAYQVELRKGFSTMWAFDDCTPCDPPPEASHITPEGKQTAEGALPQPGDGGDK
jgi:outer membrane murein-binding lipoprotein Lpp